MEATRPGPLGIRDRSLTACPELAEWVAALIQAAPARDQGDVWFVKKPVANDLHPTMKPVELIERAIRNSSKSRDAILDPFGGSGSTLIACEKSGRQGRMIELEPKYCDVAILRWEDFTGKPRLRKKGQGREGEVPIPAYEAMRREWKLGSRMVEILLRGVSTRP